MAARTVTHPPTLHEFSRCLTAGGVGVLVAVVATKPLCPMASRGPELVYFSFNLFAL